VCASHLDFLAVAIATHAVVGYALGRFLFGAGRVGVVGAVVADIDLLVPESWGHLLVHRSVTHSALAAGVATALALYWGRRTAGAVGAGYASQLVIDAATKTGIPLLFPVSSAYVGVALGGHRAPGTAVAWVLALGLLYAGRREWSDATVREWLP